MTWGHLRRVAVREGQLFGKRVLKGVELYGQARATLGVAQLIWSAGRMLAPMLL